MIAREQKTGDLTDLALCRAAIRRSDYERDADQTVTLSAPVGYRGRTTAREVRLVRRGGVGPMPDPQDLSKMSDDELVKLREELDARIDARQVDAALSDEYVDSLLGQKQQISAILQARWGDSDHYDDGHAFGWKKQPEPEPGDWGGQHDPVTEDPWGEWIAPGGADAAPFRELDDGPATHDFEETGEVSPRTAGCLRLVVLGLAIFVVIVINVLGIRFIDIDDSTSSRTVASVEEPTTTTDTAAPNGSGAVLSSSATGYVHGKNDKGTPSVVLVCAVLSGAVEVGDSVALSGSGGEGDLTATGTVGEGGRTKLEAGITEYGPKTFSSGEVVSAATGATAPVEIDSPLSVDVQGGASAPCDESTLPPAPSEEPVANPTPPGETTGTETVTTTTEGRPWSLMVAGGLDVVLLGLFLMFGMFLGWGRRRREPESDDWRATYPDWYGDDSGAGAGKSEPTITPTIDLVPDLARPSVYEVEVAPDYDTDDDDTDNPDDEYHHDPNWDHYDPNEDDRGQDEGHPMQDD